MLKNIYHLICIVFLLAVVSNPVFAEEIPTSRRYQEVVRRIKPSLAESLQKLGFKLGDPVFVRIFKESSELEIWLKIKDDFKLFKVYKICNFSGKLGPKQKVGDFQSPEGFYSVSVNQLNPSSSYHLSFNLGYPNDYDKAHSRTGSALMVHGNCVSIGCYAMTDQSIEEIYLLAAAALQNGQKSFQVNIFPFRMTADNMKRHAGSEWISFWENLKVGYDYFELHKMPPKVRVVKAKYEFN